MNDMICKTGFINARCFFGNSRRRTKKRETFTEANKRNIQNIKNWKFSFIFKFHKFFDKFFCHIFFSAQIQNEWFEEIIQVVFEASNELNKFFVFSKFTWRKVFAINYRIFFKLFLFVLVFGFLNLIFFNYFSFFIIFYFF